MNKQSFFKWLKRIILILAIIPALIFLGFAGALSLIDFNRYKPQIEQEVTRTIGHEFKIEGAIEVTVFPFRFDIGKVQVKNSPGFAAENLLTIGRTQVALSVVDLLLYKKVNIISLELVEPKLYLVRNTQGNNWSSLSSDSDTLLSATPYSAGEVSVPRLQYASLEVDAAGVPLLPVSLHNASQSTIALKSLLSQSWALDSLVVHDGEVSLSDLRTGQSRTLSHLNLLAFDVSNAQAFNVQADFSYRDSKMKRGYDFTLNTTLAIGEQFNLWTLSDWQGVIKVKLPESPTIPEMRLTTAGESLKFKLADRSIEVVKANLQGMEANLTSSFSGQLGAKPYLKGESDAQSINAKLWAQHLGVKLPNFIHSQALTKGAGTFYWVWDGETLLFEDLKIKLDDSAVSGQIWHHFGPQAETGFNLKIDKLNLDGYLAETQQKTTPLSADRVVVETSSSGAVDDASGRKIVSYLPFSLPIRTLKALHANGQLEIGELTAWGVSVKDFAFDLIAENGQIELAPLDGKLYQGMLLSQLHVDLSGDVPIYRWRGQVEQIAVKPLLQETAEYSKLSGKMQSHFWLVSQGEDGKALTENLHGVFAARVEDATLYGLDVAKLLLKQPLTASDKSHFSVVEVDGKITQGVYVADKVELESESFLGAGLAKIDLKQMDIESRIKVRLTHPVAPLNTLEGLTVPLVWQGLLESATWAVNYDALSAEPTNSKSLLAALNSLAP